MTPHFSRTAAWLLTLLIMLGVLLTPAATRTVRADVAATTVTDNVEEWSVGNGLIYWANTCFADEFNPFAELKRKPVGGGPERTLEAINDGGLCITYRSQLSLADGLYYYDYSQERIERMPLAAPFTPQVVKALPRLQGPAGAFVEAGGYLYWVNGSNAVYRVRTDGSGELETVATTGAPPSDVIVVGNTVYWTESSGVWTTSVACATLPCTGDQQRFADFGANTSAHGLLYQSRAGLRGNYRVYWVQRTTSGANSTYQIRYRACNELTICTRVAPSTLYTATLNWRIGDLVLANNNLYWTEADQSTVNNQNGDVKRKAYNATTPGADTLATGQAKIDDQLYVASDTLFFSRYSVGIFSLPLSASTIVRDFSADGLEVTQAIQNLANNAPLVANKTTYVRAYARQLAGPSTPNVEASLVGLRNGTPLPGSPLQPLNGVRALTTGGSFDRAKLNDGWYFLLPASWIAAGAITLRLEIDARQIHSDPSRGNNQLSQNISFVAQPPVCVWTVPVRTHTPMPSTSDPNFFAMVDHFKRRWPTPDVWIFRDTDPVEELEVCWSGPFPYPCHGPYELEDGWGIGGIPDRDKVIVSLWARAQLSFNPDACDDIGAPVHFMGMVHPDANNGGASGYASTVSNQSWVQLPDHLPNPVPAGWNQLRAGSVMAQELAHNYGRKHVNCGGPDNIDGNYPYPPCQIANVGADSYYGFDVTTRQPIKPDQTADFMSYASQSWVSDYTWRGLLGAFQANSAKTARLSALEQGSSVFVSGLVDADNHRGEITVLLALPTATLPPTTVQKLLAQAARLAHDSAGQAVYKLRLLDQAGAVLLERPLALSALDDHSADSNAALFSDLFPPPSGQVAEVQLLADGAVVDSARPGITSPSISIQQPASGALIDGTLTINWTASDPDPDDRLLFTVQYSHNSGASWHTLALNRPGTPSPTNSLSFSDLGSLHGSATNGALIRILASDGYNTAIATSQPFTLKDRAPEPAIIAPGAGQTFVAGQSVLLRGSATDAEDGGLAPTALLWQVDGADQGSGADLGAAGLAPGTHSAALRASDTGGQTGTATVSFSVAPLAVPLATAPQLDGACEDGAYAGGSSVPLRPYGDGAQASVRLLRSADALWACFSGLRLGTALPGSSVSVRADINNSREPLAQATDRGFIVGEDGSVGTVVGDGAGGFGAAGAGGLQAQVVASATSWSAELRIDAAALGGWDHLVGLQFGHAQVSAPSDAYLWPYTSEAQRPSSWATSALGSQPVISVIEPSSAEAGGPAFTLTITGSGFISGTLALWNGTALPTSFVNGEQLTAQVGASQLGGATLAQVTTRAPAPAPFVSNAAPFVVEAAAPTISALSPARVRALSPAFTLTVTGSNFTSDAVVLWNGAPVPTQVVSATQLTAQIGAALLANGQSVGVAVRNTLPDARISSATAFEVEPGSGLIYLPMLRR